MRLVELTMLRKFSVKKSPESVSALHRVVCSVNVRSADVAAQWSLVGSSQWADQNESE